MGIPSFYGWLVRTFPGVWEPPQATTFDNVYLDMNSIIHPCFHPEDGITEPPLDFQEVFQRIAGFIDNILAIARPRKCIYLAIDGVAPKAKMNQQRSRRFAAARERAMASLEEEKLARDFLAQGRKLPHKKTSLEVEDSNIITPGTSFMEQLSAAMQTYIAGKLASDPQWEKLRVVLSDARVPGEGEHKIMSFMRNQKKLGTYDPYASHCVYGADADLILLSLATHEQHISVLRESQEWRQELDGNPFELVDIGRVRDHIIGNMLVESSEFEINYDHVVDDFVFMCSLVGNDFLPHIPTLLINDGALDSLMAIYKTEFSRMGGYLTQTQNAEINMGALEYLMGVIATDEESFLKKKYQQKKKRRYKKRRYNRVDNVQEEYEPVVEPLDLWESGSEISQVEHIGASGEAEQNLRQQHEDSQQQQQQQQYEGLQQQRQYEDLQQQHQQYEYLQQGTGVTEASQVMQPDYLEQQGLCSLQQAAIEQGQNFEGFNTEEQVAMEQDSGYMDLQEPEVLEDEEEIINSRELRAQVRAILTRNTALIMATDRKTDIDLASPGYKTRYYSIKLGAAGDDIPRLKSDMVSKYIEGLAWVFKYYYQGLCSWQWFYPYDYAPFASDFGGIASYEFKFELGQPLRPLEQLMAVLPPQSAHALPACYRQLMTDPASPIADFYPAEFSIDYFGIRHVRNAWKGVVKLPIVANSRLLAAVAPLEGSLTQDESRRNVFSRDMVLMSPHCKI